MKLILDFATTSWYNGTMGHASTCIICDGEMPDGNVMVCGKNCYRVYRTYLSQGWRVAACGVCGQFVWTKDHRSADTICGSKECNVKMRIRRLLRNRDRSMKHGDRVRKWNKL